MNNTLKCPKCGSENIHSDKKGFSGTKAVAGAVLAGPVGLLAGTHGSGNVICTCLDCGYKYKAGEYAKEREKFEKEKKFNKKLANNEVSNIPLAIVSLLLSVFGTWASYKLWSNDWNILGFIFTIVTILCIAMSIFSFYSENERLKKK